MKDLKVRFYAFAEAFRYLFDEMRILLHITMDKYALTLLSNSIDVGSVMKITRLELDDVNHTIKYEVDFEVSEHGEVFEKCKSGLIKFNHPIRFEMSEIITLVFDDLHESINYATKEAKSHTEQ